MRKSGATYAGLQSMVEKIEKGVLDFDVCLATPTIMPQVLKLARILGPKRLLPSIKSGTIVDNLHDGIKTVLSGAQLEFRADSNGVLKCAVAYTHSEIPDTLQNMRHLITQVLNAMPKRDSAKTNHPSKIPPELFKLFKDAQATSTMGDTPASQILSASLILGNEIQVPINTHVLQGSRTQFFRK